MNELELNDKIIKASELSSFEFEKVNDDMVLNTIIYRVDKDIINSEYCLSNHWYDNDFSKALIENSLINLKEAQRKGYQFVKLVGSNYKPLTVDELNRVSDYIDDYIFVNDYCK